MSGDAAPRVYQHFAGGVRLPTAMITLNLRCQNEAPLPKIEARQRFASAIPPARFTPSLAGRREQYQPDCAGAERSRRPSAHTSRRLSPPRLRARLRADKESCYADGDYWAAQSLPSPLDALDDGRHSCLAAAAHVDIYLKESPERLIRY